MGLCHYIPTGAYHGSDSFTYKANDGTADSNVATVTLTMNDTTPANTAPVALADAYSTDQDVTMTVTAALGVLKNDTDADAGDTLTAIKVSDPTHGTLTLNADGSFVYIPTGAYHGSDSFTYKANDGTADSNVATVTLTVNDTTSVNPRPTVTIDNGPASGSTVTHINDPITGTASDADSGLRDVRLFLYRQSDGMCWNGSSWVSTFTQMTDAVTPATWSIGPMPSPGANPSTDLTDGIYAMVAAAYDNAGNNKGETRSFVVDSSAPSDISFTKIGDVSNPVDNSVVSLLTPVHGTATDTISGIKRVELILQRNSDSLYWNGRSWQAASFILSTGLSTPSGGVYPWFRNGGLPNSRSNLSNGFYTLTATAFDRNELSTSKVITVEVVAP